MLFGNFKETLLLEGTMPERALLRLRRAGIGVYKAKKIEKTKLIFRVKRKDVPKVFTIYPSACYQGTTYSPYTVQKLGGAGLGRYLEKAKSRIGLPLGGLLCLILLLLSDSLVFAVEFAGTDVYKREVYETLEQNGVRLFAPYKEGNEDGISAQLLRLSGVEYASVHKNGHRLIVEIRTSPFSSAKFEQGAMQAKHTGELIALTVIRGTPLKKLGEKVTTGERLVEDRFHTQDGGQVRVEIIARACISCVYEGNFSAVSEEEAFAQAYLSLGITEKDRVESHTVLPTEEKDIYRVTVRYTAIETFNF